MSHKKWPKKSEKYWPKCVQPVKRSLSGSRFSRHQFAFLLCLVECFPQKLTPTIVYDPEFNQEDERIIGKVKIIIIY